MLDGYKTYFVIALMAVYNILTQLGLITGISGEEWEISINVLLAVLGIIFNKVGRKKLVQRAYAAAKEGKKL
jgi:hypothetical protein